MPEANDIRFSDDAFLVRGHHATRLFNILGMGMTIEAVIEDGDGGTAEPYKGYGRDVFGDTPEQSEIAKKMMAQFFSDFLNLPDDAPVQFVTGQKDGICNSCVIGDHCSRQPQKSDERFLETIGRLAKEKGMEDKVIEGKAVTDSQNEPSRIIELPAWLARDILSDVDFHAQTYPRLLRPLVRQVVKKELKKI